MPPWWRPVDRMSGTRKVLLISLGHPELVLGGSPVVCSQELFDELRTRGAMSNAPCSPPWTGSAGDIHNPKAGITGFDGRDGVYLLHQNEHDNWLHRNNEPLLVDAFIALLLRFDRAGRRAFSSLPVRRHRPDRHRRRQILAFMPHIADLP